MPPRDPDNEGMLDLEQFERDEAEREKVRAAQPKKPEETLPSVDEEKLKAFKEKARTDIDDRLKARRKQRKLMRGGDLGK